MARAGFVFRFLKPCAVATCLGLLATCGGGDGGEVTPPPAQPVSMSISGLPTASMLPGQSAQLTATLTYSDSSTRDVTAPGPDGVDLDEFYQSFCTRWPTIRRQLLEGTYEPSAARRKSIPKPDGSERNLGIPNVQERLLQQAGVAPL